MMTSSSTLPIISVSTSSTSTNTSNSNMSKSQSSTAKGFPSSRSGTSSPNLPQHQKRGMRSTQQPPPLVPSFRQEPVLGTTTSRVVVSSLVENPLPSKQQQQQQQISRPSYSSAASASISPPAGKLSTTTLAQQLPSDCGVTANFNTREPSTAIPLAILPQRTQSAPPDIHEQQQLMMRVGSKPTDHSDLDIQHLTDKISTSLSISEHLSKDELGPLEARARDSIQSIYSGRKPSIIPNEQGKGRTDNNGASLTTAITSSINSSHQLSHNTFFHQQPQMGVPMPSAATSIYPPVGQAQYYQSPSVMFSPHGHSFGSTPNIITTSNPNPSGVPYAGPALVYNPPFPGSSPYTLTGYKDNTPIYSHTLPFTPRFNGSGPFLHPSMHNPPSALTSISMPILPIPTQTKRPISIKHPDTKEEIVFNKQKSDNLLPGSIIIPEESVISVSALEKQSTSTLELAAVELISEPTMELIHESIMEVTQEPPVVVSSSHEPNIELMDLIESKSDSVTFSQLECPAEGSHEEELLSEKTLPQSLNKVYSKELLFSMLSQKTFSCAHMEPSFKEFFELLGRPAPSYRPSSLRNAGGEDKRSTGSKLPQPVPPGYDSTTTAMVPPGFSKPLRSSGDGRMGRESSILRNRSHPSTIISRSAIISQPVLIPTEGRWIRPTATTSSDSELVIRAIKGILNKITPDNFERLSTQLIAMLLDPLTCLVASYPKMVEAVKAGIDPDWNDDEDQARSLLSEIISVFFDKAVDEPHFAPLYAGLCRTIADCSKLPEYPARKSVSDSELAPVSMFRMALLHRCKAEYEKKIAWSSELEKHTADSVSDTDAEFLRLKTKRRVLGNIAFIGHLYKQGLLREEIIYSLIIDMLTNADNKEEDEIECCIQMIHATGSKLDNSSSARLDPVFKKLKEFSASNRFSNRINFSFLDLIDLRAANWNKTLASSIASGTSASSGVSPAPPRSSSTPTLHSRKKRESGLVAHITPRSIITRPSCAGTGSETSSVTNSFGKQGANTNNSTAGIKSPQTSINKFGLLSEETDEPVISDSNQVDKSEDSCQMVTDIPSGSAGSVPVDSLESFTEEESQEAVSCFASIIKSVMSEDPNRTDLTQMVQMCVGILENFPCSISTILTVSFDSNESTQLKLCSFLGEIFTDANPVSSEIFFHLSETVKSNFDLWVEDVPKLPFNFGRIFGTILKSRASCQSASWIEKLIENSDFAFVFGGGGSYHASLFAGSFLHYLCCPLTHNEIRQCAEFFEIDSSNNNIDEFVQKHHISIMSD